MPRATQLQAASATGPGVGPRTWPISRGRPSAGLFHRTAHLFREPPDGVAAARTRAVSANPVCKVLHIGRLRQSFRSLRTGEFAKRDQHWHSAMYRPPSIVLIGEVLDAAFRSVQRPSVRYPIDGVGKNKIASNMAISSRRAWRREALSVSIGN